jgi:hypothetical protein
VQLEGTTASLFSSAATAAAILSIFTACGPGAEEREAAVAAVEAVAVEAVNERVDSVASILAEHPGLIESTRSDLRTYLNQQQVATADELGVDPVGDSTQVRRLVERGALVALEDSTDYWVVRELDHSLPYVTPDTREMLVDLGRTFHARLDSLGLPPFRFEISSVLRTAAMQAGLRSGNPNASRTTSSHEFGTTIDIAYNDFTAPARLESFTVAPPDTLSIDDDDRDRLMDRIQEHARLRLAELGEERAAELKGILGEVLADMQDGGKVQPLIERAQPVFHMTVATRYPDTGADRTRAE